MKVKMMLELLGKFDPEADVRLNGPYGDSVLFVLASYRSDKGIVWLQTEKDANVKEELEERFSTAEDDGWDETDFYADLLDTGFTIEMVRKYMGDDTAKIMEIHCLEHGLL